MNRDPLEELDAFYAACHNADVPPTRVRQPVLRFAMPALGTAFGIAAALAIATFQEEPSNAACERTVRVLAERQIASQPLAATGLHTVSKELKPWSV